MDAGTWTAFAALDFDGKLVALESKRNYDSRELVKKIMNFNPAVIACDTNPPSKQAKRIASCFGARLFYPRHSLTLEEKAFLTAGDAAKNSHERDALASARKAFHSIAENKLRSLGRKLSALKKEGERARVGKQVLLGSRVSKLLEEKR